MEREEGREGEPGIAGDNVRLRERESLTSSVLGARTEIEPVRPPINTTWVDRIRGNTEKWLKGTAIKNESFETGSSQTSKSPMTAALNSGQTDSAAVK